MPFESCFYPSGCVVPRFSGGYEFLQKSEAGMGGELRWMRY